MSYVVTDLTGREVRPGDEIMGAAGGVRARFDAVVYGPEFDGTARVRVSGREYSPEVWGLIVLVAQKDGGVACQL